VFRRKRDTVSHLLAPTRSARGGGSELGNARYVDHGPEMTIEPRVGGRVLRLGQPKTSPHRRPRPRIGGIHQQPSARSVRAATSSLACGSSTPATGADYHFRLAARRARQSHDQDVASKEVGGREDLGPIQDSGELRTRSHTRREVRPLQVHVSPARSGRMQVGPGADPRHRNLRPLHSSQRPLRHLVSVGTHARRVKAEMSDTRSHGR
jgi:hypothetical protein